METLYLQLSFKGNNTEHFMKHFIIRDFQKWNFDTHHYKLKCSRNDPLDIIKTVHKVRPGFLEGSDRSKKPDNRLPMRNLGFFISESTVSAPIYI